jgi:hypothetical protein
MLQVEEPQAGAIRSPNAIEGPMALRRRANLVMCSQQEAKQMENGNGTQAKV